MYARKMMKFKKNKALYALFVGIYMFAIYTFLGNSKTLSEDPKKTASITQSAKRTVTLNCTVEAKDLKASKWGIKYSPDSFSLNSGEQELYSLTEDTERPKGSKRVARTRKKARLAKEGIEEDDDEQEITFLTTIQNNRLVIDYHYSFITPVGTYTGDNRTIFEVPEKTDMLTISFSFDDDERVLIPEAEQIYIGQIEDAAHQ
jgi:hypothetical protein